MKIETKAALFSGALLATILTLLAYSLSHWDGCLGHEKRPDGGVEVLCLGSP